MRAQVRIKLQLQIDVIEELRKMSSGSQVFITWRKETEELLINIFGVDSTEVQELNAIYYTPIFLTCRMGDEAFEEAYRNGLEETRALLLSWMERIRRSG